MSHLAKKQAINLKPGSVITGKWNHNRYKVVRSLGQGAVGAVYLVQSPLGLSALKIGFDKMGIVSEVNVLKQLTKVQGKSLGPSFIEMDDWNDSGFYWTFYVMEYIQGDSLFSFLKKRGNEWTAVFILQLLTGLEKLHNEGWVFGDLKPENLLVSGPAPNIRWLDVGGVTRNGRSIKEFTAFFDRGYWGAGSRKAEPSYDLFSLAMIILNIAYPKRFTKTEDGRLQLERKVNESPLLRQYEDVIIKALRNEYDHAREMRNDLLRHLKGKADSETRSSQRAKRKQTSRLLKVTMFVAFLLFLYLLYLYFNNLF
ncbi:serine/threonine protein kinase [Pueribacillus theae]|uniref:Serine/threonine protein kinase n=1 Tax=Pueribacillus theae TaxID=2171751 RepID=A0A2U1K5A0_9BACI|nr:protein kinase family protein [Pueribacillus theae]PWA12138.1 serine/threonine protein kinase [Pueribacillus theae]